MPDVYAIIPARLRSTRFPRKPLADIAGKPMIRRVWERASMTEGLRGVWVATDSEEIYRLVGSFGGAAVMTKADHPSGTDRIAEAARTLGVTDSDIVLNIQGDQPVLDPEHPRLLYRALMKDDLCVASTIAIPSEDPGGAGDPNHVKVVFSGAMRALYFSRSTVPFPRGDPVPWHRHIGLYAYKGWFLYRFPSLPRLPLEKTESLEQLRILENGYQIKVVLARGASPEVDVPEDIAEAESALAAEEARGRP
ncbi:MAG: 3-deoxy-manno-octulosonate cytidylyltransferase [Deltaproteobacteria bacterium]|jgi:3-deoxy-manno-octulosonate cytidylyltransferase (CMP-KDO synthetase)|nr:3-deoxy-manno-octulosonate cytidylyltransferase [Deltaproteobacteria bacterium]